MQRCLKDRNTDNETKFMLHSGGHSPFSPRLILHGDYNKSINVQINANEFSDQTERSTNKT